MTTYICLLLCSIFSLLGLCVWIYVIRRIGKKVIDPLLYSIIGMVIVFTAIDFIYPQLEFLKGFATKDGMVLISGGILLLALGMLKRIPAKAK